MKEKQKIKAEKLRNSLRKQGGITLIALIVTIIILIILATISINIIFGDGGLLKRAEQAKELHEQGARDEADILNEVDKYLKDIIDREIESTTPDTPVDPVIPYTEVYVTLYEGGILAFSNDESKVEGLTPIEGKNWNITDEVFSIEWNLDEAPYYKATTPWFEDRESITKVVFSNEIVPKSVTALFMGCTNLTTIEGIEKLNTTNVSSLAAMFSDCVSLTSIDLSNFNTSNVTNMSHMFQGYNYDMALTEIKGLRELDTSNVTRMDDMFNSCSSLANIDVSNFETSNVTQMDDMFNGCSSLTSIDVSNFETSNVTLMDDMFLRLFKLNKCRCKQL